MTRPQINLHYRPLTDTWQLQVLVHALFLVHALLECALEIQRVLGKVVVVDYDCLLVSSNEQTNSRPFHDIPPTAKINISKHTRRESGLLEQ